jgi:hypothetical protein
MASELRVNSSTNRSGLGTITYTDSGPIVSGVGTFANGLTVDGTQTTVKSLKLTGDNYNANWFKTSNKLRFNDNAKATFGTADDLSIYHNGSDNYIDGNSNAEDHLYIRANVGADHSSNIHLQAKSGEESIVCRDDESVELYFNGNQKLRTTNTGAVVTGILTATNRVHATSMRIANDNFAAAGNADELILGDTSGNRGLTIVSGNTGIGALFFADDGSTNIGSLVYEHNTNQMRMNVNGAQVMRLDNTSVPTWIYGSDTNTYTSLPAADTIAFTTGGIERLRIDSNGLMGLGVTPTSHNNTTAFQIYDDYNSQGYPRIRLTNQSTGTTTADGYEISLDGSNLHAVHRQRENADIYFMTNNVEKLRITSGGQVQIKENAGSSSDGASLKFYFGNNNTTDVISSIIFSNNVGEVSRIQGETRNGNTNGMITFHSDISGTSAERMRINHDGAFCFGSNSARPAEFTRPSGFSVRWDAKGQFQSTVSNETCGLLNREGSDGGILSFRRGGTGVGEIGVNASTMYLNFGGTNAAAHQLDDYEEGTWTPTANYGASGITVYAARYTKVGNKVFIDFRGQLTGTNGNPVQVGGLPYANLASNAHNVGPVMHNGFDYSGSTEPVATSYITGTNSYFQMYYSQTNSTGWTAVTGNQTNGQQFITSLTYFTS